MEPGLWIYADDGVTVLFGPSTSNVTVIGVIETGRTNGSFTHALFQKGRPVIVSALPIAGASFSVPDITTSASGIAWTFPTPNANYNQPCRITFGVRA